MRIRERYRKLRKFWMEFRNDPRINPTAAEVKCKAGSLLLKAGEDANALVLFTEAVRHDPTHVGAILGLGEAHRRLGAYKEALDEFRRVIRVDPKHAEAQFKLGLIYIELKDDEMARAKYEVLLRMGHPLAHQLSEAISPSGLMPVRQAPHRGRGKQKAKAPR